MIAKDAEGKEVPVFVSQAWSKGEGDQLFGIGRVTSNDVYPINTLVLVRRTKRQKELPTFEVIKNVPWEEF